MPQQRYPWNSSLQENSPLTKVGREEGDNMREKLITNTSRQKQKMRCPFKIGGKDLFCFFEDEWEGEKAPSFLAGAWCLRKVSALLTRYKAG